MLNIASKEHRTFWHTTENLHIVRALTASLPYIEDRMRVSERRFKMGQLTSPPTASKWKLSAQDALASKTSSPSFSKASSIDTSNPGQFLSECTFMRNPPSSRVSTSTSWNQFRIKLTKEIIPTDAVSKREEFFIYDTIGRFWLDEVPELPISWSSVPTLSLNSSMFVAVSTVIEVAFTCQITLINLMRSWLPNDLQRAQPASLRQQCLLGLSAALRLIKLTDIWILNTLNSCLQTTNLN